MSVAANKVVGHQVVYLDDTDSTNLKLAQLLRSTSIAEGFVLRAGYQTSGKGQAGNVWHASPGQNLMLSVLFHPVFLKPEDQFSLNIAVSLGVFDVVNSLFPGMAAIKWSNDILLAGKKVCGILIENTLTGDLFKHSIAGIGLNVNQTTFPASLGQATSLLMQSQQQWPLEEVYQQLMQSLENRYAELKDGWTDRQREEYLSNLFGMNEERQYRVGEQEQTGIIRTVNAMGELGVETYGHLTFYGKKELTFLY